jgi:hypothetical protein
MTKIDHYDLVYTVKNHYGLKQGYFVVTEVDTPFAGIGRVDVVAFCIVGLRPVIRCFECETNLRDVAKMRGKLTQLSKLATHVYVVVPEYVYDLNKTLDNFANDGIGVITVDENKTIKERFESKIFNPERRWNMLLEKLLDFYPNSAENIRKAFEKFCKYYKIY